MTDRIVLTALVDPLCGWCYGAAPALERLAADPTVALRVMPTGLFAGEGARPMDDGFATYAWSNDQRIARLTGQPFTETYRRDVLAAPGRSFDSGPATLALLAAALEAPAQAMAALHAIQRARYVNGSDITDIGVLALVLVDIGLHGAAARIASPDDDLLRALDDGVAEARRLMAESGARGVPTLLVGTDLDRRPIPSAALFGAPEALAAQIRRS
jgi:putative protein-disulfide isomerase